MNWITEPDLVFAVSNADGRGFLATTRFTPKETRHNIIKIKKLTDKPFGINQRLVGTEAKENIETVMEEKVTFKSLGLAATEQGALYSGMPGRV
ncbi:MAG: nitronate monooxygenase [Pseudomonadota bacterium]